jgi:hypothetical protein
MTVNSISAASLGEYVLASSDSKQLQRALQTLQSSISSGDTSGAQSAFQALQNLNQQLASASGSSLASNSQLSTDLTALGSALSASDLSSAQSAFDTVKSDLNTSNSPSQMNEFSAAAQSAQLVQELLSTVNVNTNSPDSPDYTTSVLQKVYGTSSGLNLKA